MQIKCNELSIHQNAGAPVPPFSVLGFCNSASKSPPPPYSLPFGFTLLSILVKISLVYFNLFAIS